MRPFIELQRFGLPFDSFVELGILRTGGRKGIEKPSVPPGSQFACLSRYSADP